MDINNKKKKKFEKRLIKGIKIFLKKIRIKSENMVVYDIEIFQKMKKQRLLEYKKN